jgi:hypothetical protein
MKVEVYLRITLLHLAEVVYHLQGIHHTEGVREHEALDTLNFVIDLGRFDL